MGTKRCLNKLLRYIDFACELANRELAITWASGLPPPTPVIGDVSLPDAFNHTR
jgi:hypothetical protein